MEKETLAKISQATNAQASQTRKSVILDVPLDQVKEACKLVAALPNLYHLSTITGIDEGTEINLYYHFWQGREFVTVRAKLPKTSLTIGSIIDILPAAVLYEAEVYDLLGVFFQGNPLMGKKLLLPDNYPAEVAPPLRREAVIPEEIRGMMGLG